MVVGEVLMARTIQTVTELRERAQRRASGDVQEAEFRSRFAALLAQAPPHTVRDQAFFFVPAKTPPWFDTGFDCRAGDHLTVFAAGRTYLSRELDLWISPHFQLWYRIGERGEVFRGTRCSHTFTAPSNGRLFLAGYFPGQWATRTGDLAVPADVYSQVEGGISALVLRWAAEPLAALKRLAQLADVGAFLSGEIDRLEDPISTPAGWEYLWFVGPSETYTVVPHTHQRQAIACYTHADAAILQKDVPLPFTPDTRLRWSWKTDVLPSRSREDDLFTHDYLSPAVEFDNGQDLTYLWSAELPPETGFRCPIPTWQGRETHVVVRSGQAGLGQWVTEERNLYADYKRWVGDPPAAIVRVWLIALSLFRRQEGQCEYGNIELLAENQETVVN
jgi:hypothetical protein